MVDKTLNEEALSFNGLPYNNVIDYNPIYVPPTVSSIGTL